MASYVAAAKNGENVLVKGFDEAYAPAIFTISTKTKSGIVSAETAGKTVVALDVVLTDALIKEGIVRDTVRQCQLIRKEAGYDVEQHVRLCLTVADETVLAALEEKKDFMAAELLADELTFGDTTDADLTKDVEIADKAVRIAVCKS